MLTNDDLEKFSSDGKLAGDCEVESMARELLAIREAGDEEIGKLEKQREEIVSRWLSGDNLDKESLCQQLREAKRREQIMAHHCQKYVEITWEQAEAAYDAAEPVEISREEIDRIVGLVLAMNDEELEGKDLRQQLREAQAEIERLKRENDTIKGYFPKGAFEAKPQHEDGGGGYYDLLPGGLDQ